jgi:hypothetical protein
MLSHTPTNSRIIAAAAIAWLATASNGVTASLTPQEHKLVEDAKKEGAVTVLNPIFSDRTGERLGEAFIKRYDLGPDFKTFCWSAHPGSLTRRPSAAPSRRLTAGIGRTTPG